MRCLRGAAPAHRRRHPAQQQDVVRSCLVSGIGRYARLHDDRGRTSSVRQGDIGKTGGAPGRRRNRDHREGSVRDRNSDIAVRVASGNVHCRYRIAPRREVLPAIAANRGEPRLAKDLCSNRAGSGNERMSVSR